MITSSVEQQGKCSHFDEKPISKSLSFTCVFIMKRISIVIYMGLEMIATTDIKELKIDFIFVLILICFIEHEMRLFLFKL